MQFLCIFLKLLNRSCTGIRLGSVVAPSPAHAIAIKSKQVPWSVNTMALAFLSEAVKDDEFMQRTWEETPSWRKHLVELLQSKFPAWEIFGEPYLSWVWVDTKCEIVSRNAVSLAKQNGVPIRSGKPGYNLPTYIRIAVRNPEMTKILLDAWKSL